MPTIPAPPLRRVYAVVGPSGAGKDTLLALALARRPDLRPVRRVITRPAEAGGEEFEGVDAAEFARRRDAGEFALHWRAQGLCYGLPAAAFAAGGTPVFNGSRGMLRAAAAAFPGLRVIHVTAPADVLARRLTARGRESGEEIRRRLDRAVLPLPPGLDVAVVENGGGLEPALAAFLGALWPGPVPVA